VLALLPPLCFAVIFVFFLIALNQHRAFSGWRTAFVFASLVWAVWLVVITEVLSVSNAIVVRWVLGLWALPTVLLASLCLAETKKAGLVMRTSVFRVAPVEGLLLGGVALIVAVTGLIALTAPPNTSDSMTYHMSRVVHWTQNHTVAHYPTHIVGQLSQGPWAEFAVMHLDLLRGGDRFANVVQWFSMIASLIAVSLIARQLGADRPGQILAAAVSATLPMGILQASSTQNDYVLSFWLACFVYFLLQLRASFNWTSALAAGVSLGLAYLTKSTAYLYSLPFLAGFALAGSKTLGRKLWKPALVIALLPLCLNLGHYARNVGLFGHPLGPGQESSSAKWVPALGPSALILGETGATLRYANDTFTPSSLLSNVLRNLSLHIATPDGRVNASLEDGVRRVHSLLGMDMNDPRTTWTETNFHIPRSLSYHEGYAGNPLHLLLILLSATYVLMFAPASKEPGPSRDAVHCAWALTAAFLLFCLYLKWQPWHSRLHLPLFVLWSPLIAGALSQIRPRRIGCSVAVALIIFTTNRTDQYFRARLYLRHGYIGAARFIDSQRCSEVGLLLTGYGDWEYPFWVRLQKNHTRLVRLDHVHVGNVSSTLSSRDPFRQFRPCGVITVDHSRERPTKLIANDRSYEHVWSSRAVHVFMSN